MACVDTEYYDPKWHKYVDYKGICEICGREETGHMRTLGVAPKDDPEHGGQRYIVADGPVGESQITKETFDRIWKEQNK